METIKEDRSLEKLRELVFTAHDAGFDSLCLKCQRGFNGEVCSCSWPPSAERIDQALQDPRIREMGPIEVYAWISWRIRSAKDTLTLEKLFTMRDKLSEAIR